MSVRFSDACAYAGEMIARGNFVFSPIAHNVPILQASKLKPGWDTWSSFDLQMLGLCDQLLVLMLDGWQDSNGVRAEILAAKNMKIPVVFVNPFQTDVTPLSAT